jgi:1,3-beta-glucanosyltransferase GAS1
MYGFPGLVRVDTPNATIATPLPDYTSFAQQITRVSPTGIPSASYTPTNSPQACPTVASSFKAAATPLPPTPDAQSCACMVRQLSCVVKSSTSTDDYGSLFGSVCGAYAPNCVEFSTNATSGVYGKYSMCNPQEKLSLAFDRHYKNSRNGSWACDWSGAAVLQKAGSC